MSQAAYAAAKGAERMTAAQQAVADGLETMAKAIDAQDAKIEATTKALTHAGGIAIKTADAAETRSIDALSKAHEANLRLADFMDMTIWQRIVWIVTGRA